MLIRTITSFQELETVRAYWEDWQNHPNSDFAHFKLVCRIRDEVLRPLVIVVERNGKPCTLLAARLERSHFNPAIGYFIAVRVPALILTVIHEGLLGLVDDEIAEMLVRHVWSLLSSKEADAAVFNHLHENSPLLKALLYHKQRWWRDRKPIWSKHWDMEILGEQGFLLNNMKSKHRYYLRKVEKELTSAFQNKVSWLWVKRFDDLPHLCERIEEVAALTYQRGLGAGFVNDEEYRQRFDLFARRGLLRMLLLEAQGKIRAFWMGIIYRGTYYSSETGYDPALRKYYPGTLVFLHMVNELVREETKNLDFGLGDADYKQRFGDRCWQEATVRLFAPTGKGFILRLCLGFFAILDRTARKLVQKAGILDRIKTYWRRRLAAAAPNNDDE